MPRPYSLDPLFKALTTLPGIGPKNAKLFERLIKGPKVVDLLWHLPIDFIDRRYSPSLKNIEAGRIATLMIKIEKHSPNARRGLPYRVKASDGTGMIDLVFFNANRDWLQKQLPLGKTVCVSGKIEKFQGALQMVHPDAIVKPEEKSMLETLEPVYPLTQGVSNKILRKAMGGALDLLPKLEDWLDPAHKKIEKWPDWYEAVMIAHEIEEAEELLPSHPARSRLAYDELLSNQLALALVRLKQRRKNGRSFSPQNHLRQKVLDALPFSLTGAQQSVLKEIDEDMSKPLRMLRLLQGDVGSGKTIVACLSMINAVENGSQAALLAPTEILARQHAESLKPLFDAAGIRFVILTGRDKGKQRDILLQQIANGAAQIIIGTHAIFQESIEFQDLGLAVIDEQHRFGVHQRLQLSSKSKGVDVLVMTATPIPRTLTLTAYGDMDVSRLDEKPPGRKPIDTRLVPQEREQEMITALTRKIEKGARIYWVCPLVEDSEVLDLKAAEERFDILQSIFESRVGLVHGRLKPDEKDKVMQQFAAGDLDILVATTVIEVGVNVPEATIMVIEHAERFGLSQLHQLRGRVGRGVAQSFCFLVYGTKLTETAKERLKIMRQTEDGFLIAEKDLELRGGGEVLGTRQSGLPSFRLAQLPDHTELLRTARDDARLILEKDPNLESERGQALKTLLYLFEQDQAIANLQAG